MAPLPKPFSLASYAINAAISEGRAEEAMHKLIHALRSTNDKAVRSLAADWIERIGLPPGSAKALRRGKPRLLEDWLEISEMVGQLKTQGKTYNEAVDETAAHFGCGIRHVQDCFAVWNESARTNWDEE